MAGLTIVGLGPARPEHLTREAAQVLEQALHSGARVYGLAHVRELVSSLVPGLEVRPIDYLYGLPGVPRPVAYKDLAQMLTRRAFEDAVDVVYVVAGSPLFVNDAVMWIRRTAAERALPLRLVHGMSFVDLILDRVFWTGHQGLQLLSAWNVARDGMDPSTRSPVILFQLGESSSGGDAVDADGSPAMLVAVRDRLSTLYPSDHPVIVLYSSGSPEYRSLARRIPLSELADAPVPVYSNLWIPALDGPDFEREMAPESQS
jgi:tetrapyrrole methylase family protein/MazG family protein